MAKSRLCEVTGPSATPASAKRPSVSAAVAIRSQRPPHARRSARLQQPQAASKAQGTGSRWPTQPADKLMGTMSKLKQGGNWAHIATKGAPTTRRSPAHGERPNAPKLSVASAGTTASALLTSDFLSSVPQPAASRPNLIPELGDAVKLHNTKNNHIRDIHRQLPRQSPKTCFSMLCNKTWFPSLEEQGCWILSMCSRLLGVCALQAFPLFRKQNFRSTAKPHHKYSNAAQSVSFDGLKLPRRISATISESYRDLHLWR